MAFKATSPTRVRSKPYPSRGSGFGRPGQRSLGYRQDYYPPSSLQISNIQAGTGATNVVPGELTALFNIRFNTTDRGGLRSRIEDIFSQHGLQTEFQWQLSGPRF